MASKRAKQKQTLEKAKQLVLKNKKGKAKAKPKQNYPEGQNAPQSKAYTIENDKTQSAKRTGWRFTKEGAKRLKKDINATPSQADVDKYRNQTFKVKGNVNKSGPKGTSDGSHRYIYIERRADKSDLKRTQKLAHGGKTKKWDKGVELVNQKTATNDEQVWNLLNKTWKKYNIVNSREFDLETPYNRGWVNDGDSINIYLVKKDDKYYWDWEKSDKMAKGGETYTLDYFKNKLDELDPDGNAK